MLVWNAYHRSNCFLRKRALMRPLQNIGKRGWTKTLNMSSTGICFLLIIASNHVVLGLSFPQSSRVSPFTPSSPHTVRSFQLKYSPLKSPTFSQTKLFTQHQDAYQEKYFREGVDESTKSTTPFVGLPSYRRIIFFVATTVLIWVSEPLLSLVDSAMVGRYAGKAVEATGSMSVPNLSSVIQLAALGPATMLCDSSIYLTLFIAMATTNKLARAFAKDDVDDQITTLSHVMGVSLAVGTLIAVLIFFQGHGLLSSIVGPAGATALVESAKGANQVVDLTPEVLRAALGYARIRSAVFPFAVMGLTAQAALLCAQDTKTPALAVMVASAVNIVGDYLFVAKMKWGVRGAALATSLASVLSNGILLRKSWKIMNCWKRDNQDKKNSAHEETTYHNALNEQDMGRKSTPFVSFPDRKSLVSLLKLAGPMFFVLIGKTMGYSAMTIRTGYFGMVSLACHNVLMRIFFFYCTFGDGLSHAAQTFLPGLLYRKSLQQDLVTEVENVSESSASQLPGESSSDGDDKNARTFLKRLLLLSFVVGCVNSNTARFIANNAGKAFTTDASLVSLMSHVSPLMGLALLIHPVTMTLEGSIIAGRDLKFLVGTYVASIFVLTGKLKFFCGDFAAVWKSLVLFQLVRIFQFGGRVWRRTASSKRQLLNTGTESSELTVY
ncbi:hypothetical protein ACHAXS_014075 [Conticribra weissflogii]